MPKYTFFAYRPILSMAGLYLIAGWAALRLPASGAVDRFDPEGYGSSSKKSLILRRRYLAIGVAAVCVFYAVGLGRQTFNQAERWGPVSLWREAFLKLPPYSSRVEKVAYLDVMVNFTRQLTRPEIDMTPVETLRHVRSGNNGPKAEELESGVDWMISTFPRFKPRVAKIIVNLGGGLRRYGDPDGAVRLYERAKTLDPLLPEAYLNLGLIYAERGDHRRARDYYAQALRVNHNFATAHFLTGTSFLMTGDLSQAIGSFSEALKLRPRYRDAHVNLGVALVRAGRFSDAVPHLEQALAQTPNDAGLHFTLGVALARSGHAAEAVDHFQRVLAINPRHQAARENLDILEGRR
jgi:tetratricopeptide (TPR) repeat protein